MSGTFFPSPLETRQRKLVKAHPIGILSRLDEQELSRLLRSMAALGMVQRTGAPPDFATVVKRECIARFGPEILQGASLTAMWGPAEFSALAARVPTLPVRSPSDHAERHRNFSRMDLVINVRRMGRDLADINSSRGMAVATSQARLEEFRAILSRSLPESQTMLLGDPMLALHVLPHALALSCLDGPEARNAREVVGVCAAVLGSGHPAVTDHLPAFEAWRHLPQDRATEILIKTLAAVFNTASENTAAAVRRAPPPHRKPVVAGRVTAEQVAGAPSITVTAPDATTTPAQWHATRILRAQTGAGRSTLN